ncbi:transporter substrate-binding domain-containing protein [Paracoccus sp. TK19116]|uniref:Transporter substrate-binding domain-containing protein n=1 Tax=Paracoccus albicereus TaxID=2922394 RepID=A0ABT1MP59_9RHOB|nr:transporter substrate-binding domain-containing protein [Paracoccus albicereus]MCQ0969894.1 transporter substrate-binding domain-containing protein [Paracoccus albicereus]
MNTTRRTATALALILTAGIAQAQDTSYTVALDGTFAPHAMPNMSGGIEGFNVDLTAEIGKRLGADIEIVATQFSGVLPGMQAGTYDFVVAPVTLNEERDQAYLFTEGYLDTDFQFLVPADGEDITDLSQLSGKTVSVNKGSAYDSWAREMAPEIGWTVESYGTATDAVQAVLSGRADATVAGNTVMAWTAKQNPAVKLSYLHKTGLVWAMPFRKDSDDLRRKVEAAIECMKTDGTMVALSEKWFGVTPEEGAAAVTPRPGWGEPGTTSYVEDDHEPSCG